jgi:deoxyribonuclease V
MGIDLYSYTYDLVRQIPDGMISTYGSVAKALGDIKASRAVGRMMNQNPDADEMPCFKIVQSDGTIGGFGLGIDDKIRRLNQDNILVKDNKIINFEKVFFNDFKTSFPLNDLRKDQLSLREKLIFEDDFDEIESIAGFDVAYPQNDWDNCCGACVVIDYKSKEIIERQTVHMKTLFPYIPTYLSYRELPIIEKLFKKIMSKPTVLMFDGNGYQHPIGFGYACHAGVELDIPSIGVAKSRLCGQIGKNNYVNLNNQTVGFAFYANNKVKNPVYVSSGHKISLKKSIEIVKNLSITKYPEPLKQAHIFAKESLH